MSRVRWEVFVHLVWGTWNREPMLKEDIRPRVFGLIRKKAEDLGCEVLAVGGVEDHLHVLVSLAPQVVLPELVKNLKGASSHFINNEYQPDVPFKWQSGYGAFSVSKGNIGKTRAYIEDQWEHHRNGDWVEYYEI